MLYIVGVPRAGKSTFAGLIKELYQKVNLISSDAISNSLSHIFPEISLKSRAEEVAKMIAEIAEWNEILTGHQTVIDVGEMSIEQVYKTAKENNEIICLGFGGNMTNQQIWDLITKNHEEYDYTYGMDLERVLKRWGDFAKRDCENKIFCERNKLNYVDTSKNRNEVFKQQVLLLHYYFDEFE